MIRIGIIGCGRILPAHLRGYRLLREAGFDGFQITALCARKLDDARSFVTRGEGPPQRKAVSEIPGDPLAIDDQFLSDFQDDVDVAVFDDFPDLIASDQVDAVNDYTTHGLHHIIAAVCAENGKHLLTQKPLAVTVAAAAKMCELFEDARLTLGVFENWRFRPDIIRILRLLKSGNFGETKQILHSMTGAWWAPNQIVAETPWRHVKDQAGGITLDMGVHQFDFVRAAGGELSTIGGKATCLEPTRITLGPDGKAVNEIPCDADDTYSAFFETKSGVSGSVGASWSGAGEATTLGPGPIAYTSTGRFAGPYYTPDGGSRQLVETIYDESVSDKDRSQDFPLGLVDGFALTQLNWLESIGSGKEPIVSGREGLRDLACAWAVLESSLAGRQVTLDEILSGELRNAQKPVAEFFKLDA
jgi:1,5-anhydro-D-fructose reductase (1,5-anhydro-D-mannitol-forming)